MEKRDFKKSLHKASGEKCSVSIQNGVDSSDEKPPNHLLEFGVKINEHVRELQRNLRGK